MDSPETAKITSSTSLDSPPVQDSPFFNYISNLSPIKAVKSSAHAVRELPGLSSPPIVFKTPRTKQPSETNVLKRSQSLQLSIVEACQNINRAKDGVDGSVDSEQFISVSQSGSIAETQKECNVDDFFENHPSSSSGCVDEFLADPGGADCVNSTYSDTPSSKKLKNAADSFQSGPNETILELDDRNSPGRNVGIEQAENDIQGEQSFDVKSVGNIEEQRDGEWSSYECLNIETNLPIVPEEDCQNSLAPGTECRHQNDCESTFQHSPEPFHIQTFKDHVEDVDEFSDVAENIMHHGHQVSENQRGVLRRCLHFEEAPQHATVCSDSPLNLANTVKSLKLSTSGTGLEDYKSCHVELNETSERRTVNLSPSTAPSLHPRSSEKCLVVSKPLGIGLHLNSFVNAESMGCTRTAGKKSTGHYMRVLGMKSGMASNNLAGNTKSCSMTSSAVEKDSASNEDRISVNKALIVPSSVTNEFQHTAEDHYAALDENGKSNSPNADNFEENDQPSPIKKRKKTTSTGGNDGCKRCNCKKTKCLKLYCDCFAAGIYCTDPCSCQGCFNRPEYEKTVLETREQIESRNPLAFAPKIVQHNPELPSNHGEDGNWTTPSSARHKSGCNCKKSMCLKKYCECYQANVGCSSGCRCEGCKNIYGRKEVNKSLLRRPPLLPLTEYTALEHGMTKMVSDRVCKENLERASDKESEMVGTKRDLLCTESINPQNLTPLTPSFQYSDHGKDAPKYWFLSRRYLPSPDSSLSILSSNKKTKSPPRDSEKSDVLLEVNDELLDEGSYDWQVDYNVGIEDSISSQRDSVPNVHHLAQHPDASMPMTSSTSFSKRNCRNLSQNQLFPGSDRLSSNSMHRHCSPLTPMTRLCGETKSCQGLDSGSVQLVDILEDETPVKVGSPNKKRVSPPHSHIFKLGSGSSGKLKSGRKFILKSVPSFPPLTPCIDSKGSNSENTDKPQDDKGRSQNVIVNPCA